MRSARVTFNGITFRLYPDSPHEAHRRYFTPGPVDRARGTEDLHREVWKAAHGPIPTGCHIHHRDGDPLNNSLDNLECLTTRGHAAMHGATGSYASPARLVHLDRIRPMTTEWHRSEAGREWHREHGKRAWQSRRAQPRTCVRCEKTFESITLRASDRFCSNACKSAWRRAAGVDNEARQCARCGATFEANRYSRVSHCSRSCAIKHARALRSP